MKIKILLSTIPLMLSAHTVFAGKLEMPDEMQYPNVIPPTYQFGGYGDKLSNVLTGIRDIAFNKEGHLLISNVGEQALLELTEAGKLVRSVSSGKDGTGISYAAGLFYRSDNGHVLIIDAASKRLAEYDEELNLVRTLDIPQSAQPHDVAMLGDRVFITDNVQNVIHLYRYPEGDYLGSRDPQWKGQGLRLPQGINVSGDHLVVADSGNNRLMQISADGEAQSAWGTWGSYGGQLATPVNIDVSERHIYVADQINHRIQVFGPDGDFQYQWARHPPTAHEGNGRVHYPSAIAYDHTSGLVAVCEVIESRCQVFGNKQVVGSVASVDDSAWWEKSTRFHYGARPTMSASFLAVSEPDTHSVLIFEMPEIESDSVKPRFITRVGGQGSDPGQLIQPSGLYMDGKRQTIWVSDRGNLRVQQFAFSKESGKRPEKAVEPGAGIPKMTTGPGSSKLVRAVNFSALRMDGMEKGAKRDKDLESVRYMGEPSAMALHPNGDVYMVDPAIGRVHVFSKKMELKHTWGEMGDAPAQLIKPLDIAISPDGKRIYVVDEYAFKVKVYSRKGEFLFSWGGPGAGDNEFVTPFGIAIDSDGNVFVSDTAKNEVKKFNPDGKFLLKWGSWGVGPGEFYKPKGLAMSDDDQLVLMDFGNHRGQIFDTKGNFITMFGISANPDEI